MGPRYIAVNRRYGDAYLVELDRSETGVVAVSKPVGYLDLLATDLAEVALEGSDADVEDMQGRIARCQVVLLTQAEYRELYPVA